MPDRLLTKIQACSFVPIRVLAIVLTPLFGSQSKQTLSNPGRSTLGTWRILVFRAKLLTRPVGVHPPHEFSCVVRVAAQARTPIRKKVMYE